MSECMYIYIYVYIYITLLNEHYNNSCDDHDHDSITMFTASVHNIQYVCIYIYAMHVWILRSCCCAMSS